MKRDIVMCVLVGFFLLLGPLKVEADRPIEIDFHQLFHENGSIMLLINARTGEIVLANKAASGFYGYPVERLESMSIFEINALAPEEVEKRMTEAAEEQRSYYVLEQRLANGDIRTVEVYSCPHTYDGETYVFATIFDITDKIQLEALNRKINNTVILLLSFLIVSVGLFSFILFRNLKKLKEQHREIQNHNRLRKTFIDSHDHLVYLKDENYKYLFVNKAVAAFYKKDESQIIGRDDFELSDEEFAQKQRETDEEVLRTKTISVNELKWKDRVFKAIKFPVQLINGQYGIGAYIEDVTETYVNKKKEEKNLLRNQILVDVLTRNFETTQEQLDYVLNECLRLTESKFGYMFLYDEENQEFTLNSWSKDVPAECKLDKQQIKYKLEHTGLWGEVVRQRKPIIVNDYQGPNDMKKGYPEGHIRLSRFMSIPVIVDNKIVAVVGLANKEGDYDYNDVYQITALMNGVWNAKERREALVTLAVERNKFFQTLLSIGDGVIVVDLNGKVTMLNQVAEKLTGWTNEEAEGRHYKEVFAISPEAGFVINDPIEDVLKTDAVQKLRGRALLISKNGEKYYVEDSASPIKDDKGFTTGVVLVFRDITESEQQRKRIESLSYHDSLTGLYNRVYFEEELKRVDTAENLPISIIVGDMNGLKLANDIFGHDVGDLLLCKAAETLKRICRPDDIISRVGGDEFTVILPRTSVEEAEEMIHRIREEFSKESVKAIRGSISLGCDAKIHESQDILEILRNAENKMYSVKAFDRHKLKTTTLKTIIGTLFQISPDEERHAKSVRSLCERIGRALKLSEVEVKRLKEAGFYHDIGKIIWSRNLLNKYGALTEEEKKELKQHSIIGYRILNSFDDTLDLAEPVLAHHEKWDGTGYPKGLKGEQIPLLARIITLAEYYDTITSGRYSKPLSYEEAVEEIKRQAGSRFDPKIVDVFVGIGVLDDEEKRTNKE